LAPFAQQDGRQAAWIKAWIARQEKRGSTENSFTDPRKGAWSHDRSAPRYRTAGDVAVGAVRRPSERRTAFPPALAQRGGDPRHADAAPPPPGRARLAGRYPLARLRREPGAGDLAPLSHRPATGAGPRGLPSPLPDAFLP